jgi:hypothetical protein
MEYASGGELFDYIVANSRAPEPEACRFFHQILAGVERVHAMRVVHRDLKPENLLLDERKDIKIVDFGLSNTYKEGQLLQTACGSPCYAAPEMIAGHRYVPSMCDIWSCGVILFALVCGYLPFEDQNHAELYKKILHAEYEMPNFVSKEVADLISGMLTVDPTRRYTLEDIRAHQWYQQIPEASLQRGPGSPVSSPLAASTKATAQEALDEEILEQLDQYGFDRTYAVKCLQTNKHNQVTTTYYLLREKRKRQQLEGTRSDAFEVAADLDATGFEETDMPLATAAAVAAVATPLRSGGYEADRGYGRGPAWLDEEGGLQMPDQRGAMARAVDSAYERAPAAGPERPIPKLDLNQLAKDEPLTTRPSSARSGCATAVTGAASVASAAAAAMAGGGAGASSSRSPRGRPPAPPNGHRGYGENIDPQMAWMPSPQRLAFEGPRTPRGVGPGTPRGTTPTPHSARRGGPRAGYSHADGSGMPMPVTRRRSGTSDGGVSRTSRRAHSPWGAQGAFNAWPDASETYRREREASPFRQPQQGPPPLSARPRLQGNSGYRERSSPSHRSGRPGPAWNAQGRPIPGPAISYPHGPPLSARGASGRECRRRTGDPQMPMSARGTGGGSRATSRASSSNARANGTIHIPCTAMKNPREITQEVLRSLNVHQINCKQVSSFLVRCQTQNVRFEAEVLRMDQGYMLRFLRVSGDIRIFEDICRRLRAEMRVCDMQPCDYDMQP